MDKIQMIFGLLSPTIILKGEQFYVGKNEVIKKDGTT